MSDTEHNISNICGCMSNVSVNSSEAVKTSDSLDLGIPRDIRIAGASMGFLIVTSAIIGNFVLIMSVYKTKELQKRATVFIVSLAVSEILQNLLGHSWYVYTYIVGEWRFGALGCLVNKIIVTTAWTVCSVHIIAITISRYIIIVHPTAQRAASHIIVLILVTTCMYILPFILVLFGKFKHIKIAFGLSESGTKSAGKYYFNVRKMYCFARRGSDRTEERSHDLILLLAYVIVLLVLAYCYIRIYTVIRKSRKRVTDIKTVHVMRHMMMKREYKIVKACLISLLYICVSFLTLPLISLLDKAGEFPESIYLIGVLALWSGSGVNWFIYGLVSSEFCSAYKTLFSCGRLTINRCSADQVVS